MKTHSLIGKLVVLNALANQWYRLWVCYLQNEIGLKGMNMRKRILISLAAFVTTLVCATEAQAQCTTKTTATTTTTKHTWHKSNEGTWKGDCNGQECTYRLSNGKLKQKFDGGEWHEVTDAVWYDYTGKKYRYINNAVSASIDGVNWQEVKGSYWLSSNGYWYRLDNNEEIWWDKFDKMETQDW